MLFLILGVQEHSKSGRVAEEGGGGLPSPQVHIRRLCAPGAYAGGASDYADGDTASVTTSGPRGASTAHEVRKTDRYRCALLVTLVLSKRDADIDRIEICTSHVRDVLGESHEQAASTLESDESFGAGKRDRAGTKAEKDLTKLFERWLNSTTSVLSAAIFGDDSVRSTPPKHWGCGTILTHLL